jgi:hypothetical protein
LTANHGLPTVGPNCIPGGAVFASFDASGAERLALSGDPVIDRIILMLPISEGQ